MVEVAFRNGRALGRVEEDFAASLGHQIPVLPGWILRLECGWKALAGARVAAVGGNPVHDARASDLLASGRPGAG
jgi:hypothetical protein